MASSTLRALLRLFPCKLGHGRRSFQIGPSTSCWLKRRVAGRCPTLTSSIKFLRAINQSDINPDDGPPVAVAVPLSERRESHLASLTDLRRWREEALRQVSSLGSTLLAADGGPDASDLRRELDWLLDDAVKGYISYHQDTVEPRVEQNCSWDDIHSRLLDNPRDNDASLSVVLRASLGFLSEGWKQRVKERRPFQYLVACAYWRDLVLTVQEGVLIPRPETEQLIDLAQSAMLANPSLAEGVWVDLGTGSGAIAIALQQLLGPPGYVIAVDASPVAIAVARANIERCSLQDKIQVQQGSWFSAPGPMRNLAGVISNPPYIPTPHLDSLQAEVGKHEPRTALDGGEDGMDHIRLICEGAASTLAPGGFLALETNGGEQAHQVAQLLSNSARSFIDVQVVNDFANMARFVTAIHTDVQAAPETRGVRGQA